VGSSRIQHSHISFQSVIISKPPPCAKAYNFFLKAAALSAVVPLGAGAEDEDD